MMDSDDMDNYVDAMRVKKTMISRKNPRVVLKPLMADQRGVGPQQFATSPFTAKLFNNSEFSDVKLVVGGQSFHAHKLILSSSSTVFSNMFDNRWIDGHQENIALEESEECAEHFDKFLKFLYTSSIIIYESYVWPIFLLADKYAVTPLYDECGRIITKGLKVYWCRHDKPSGSKSNDEKQINVEDSSSSSESSDLSMLDSSDDEYKLTTTRKLLPVWKTAVLSSNKLKRPNVTAKSRPREIREYLEASQVFPISTVLEMTLLCHDPEICRMALNNLEARLSKQISNEYYTTWNSVPRRILVMMLEDDNFFCDEKILFNAVKTWLSASTSPATKEEDRQELLSRIRYGTMKPHDLYVVEKDPAVQECPSVKELVYEAVRYQAFSKLCFHKEQKWKEDKQFQKRRAIDKST